MDIEKAKKLVRGLVFNDDGTMVNYIDFTSADYDSWNGYTLKEYAEAIETLLTAYEKEKETTDKLKKINIPVDTLIAEFERLEDLEDDREMLKAELEKEKEKNKELQSDIQQKNFEIKCLNSDIKNMYCEEGIIAILEDNFNLNREEAIQILEEN